MFYKSDVEKRCEAEILEKAENLFPTKEKKVYERVLYVKNHASKIAYYNYLVQETLYQCCINNSKSLTLTGNELADLIGVTSEIISEEYEVKTGSGTFNICKNKLDGEISLGISEKHFVNILEKYEETFLKILKELSN